MTSVEFIISNIQSSKWEYTPLEKRKLIIEHAKEMHQKEVEEAWEDGRDSFSTRSAEKYYNETFKPQN